MKKITIILTVLIAITINSNAQNVFIPDANFKAFLNTNYPSFMVATGDSLIPDSAATLTGTLDCSMQNIADLTGIECFINIEELGCSYNQLTSLPDLSANTVLKILYCYSNGLTSLPDLSANTALQILNCSGNQLTSLPDLSANTALQDITCSGNQLTSLPDLSADTALQKLYCYNNQLTTLPDLSANTALKTINSYNNLLTSLPDLSANTALKGLYCYNNQLTSLPDLSANTALKTFYCSNNQLTSLPDLSANTALEYLDCGYNQLTSLPDLSANTALQDILCSNNQLTSLPDLSAYTVLHLHYLYCYSNQLTSLPDLSANTALQRLCCYNNKLDFSDAKELRIADALPSLSDYEYSPQNPFGVSDTFNFCVGNTAVLSIAAQDSALSYQWFKGTDIITGATDTSLIISNITASDTGVYTCKSYGTALLSPPMTHGPGISEFISKPIIINVNINTDTTFAETACDSYTSPSGNYIWTTSGTYYDTIPNLVGCDSLMTINLTIIIVDTSVTGNGITLTANAVGANYQWLDCNDAYSVISGETNQSFTATENGSYAVEITENGCTDTSSCYLINSIGIKEELSLVLGEIAIYPNPAKDIITIEGNNIESVEVKDIQGQLISQFTFVTEKFNLDLSKQPKGVYFLTIKTAQRTVIEKVILE